jgi:predicted HicB family RNase H-like nuclease
MSHMTKKNLGGRPRTIDRTERQWGSQILNLRVTPKQMESLKDEADYEEISVSELVRQRVFGKLS